MPRHYARQPQSRTVRSNPAPARILSFLTNQPGISAAMREQMNRTMDEGFDPKTLKKHKAAVFRFIQFCDYARIPQKFRYPASEDTLCAFVTSLKGKLKGATIAAKISAVKRWHMGAGKGWFGGERLRATLKGAVNNDPDSGREQREPVTFEMLQCLNENLDASNGKDAAVSFVANLLFHGQARQGEILPSSQSISQFNSKRHPTVREVKPKVSEKGSRYVHAPYTKTKRFKGEDIYMPKQSGSTCPVDAWKNSVQVNRLGWDDPLAAYRDDEGELKVLSGTSFLSRCNNIWRRFGYSRRTGHCFRIGGTGYLLKKGVSPPVVKTFGRWKSDAFFRYWRHHEVIGELYLEELDN